MEAGGTGADSGAATAATAAVGPREPTAIGFMVMRTSGDNRRSHAFHPDRVAAAPHAFTYARSVSCCAPSTPSLRTMAWPVDKVGGGRCEERVGMVVAVGLKGIIHFDETIVACLEAGVAGTFLYISIIEVGMKELLVCRRQAGVTVLSVGSRLEVAKLASFFFGWLFMSFLAVYV